MGRGVVSVAGAYAAAVLCLHAAAPFLEATRFVRATM